MSLPKRKFIAPSVAVVDDSSQSRQFIIDILERNNIAVVGQAGSAEDGLSLMATTEANIYLIDLVMPLRSGIELSKIIAEKGMGINIIMMSSVSIESLVIESISAGAIDFLPKPFTEKKLLKSLQKISHEMNRD